MYLWIGVHLHLTLVCCVKPMWIYVQRHLSIIGGSCCSSKGIRVTGSSIVPFPLCERKLIFTAGLKLLRLLAAALRSPSVRRWRRWKAHLFLVVEVHLAVGHLAAQAVHVLAELQLVLAVLVHLVQLLGQVEVLPVQLGVLLAQLGQLLLQIGDHLKTHTHTHTHTHTQPEPQPVNQ